MGSVRAWSRHTSRGMLMKLGFRVLGEKDGKPRLHSSNYSLGAVLLLKRLFSLSRVEKRQSSILKFGLHDIYFQI